MLLFIFYNVGNLNNSGIFEVLNLCDRQTRRDWRALIGQKRRYLFLLKK